MKHGVTIDLCFLEPPPPPRKKKVETLNTVVYRTAPLGKLPRSGLVCDSGLWRLRQNENPSLCI